MKIIRRQNLLAAALIGALERKQTYKDRSRENKIIPAATLIDALLVAAGRPRWRMVAAEGRADEMIRL